MDKNILLEKNRSKESSNIDENISIGLEKKIRMLESDKLQDDLSLYSLYNKERDECNRYRLLFVINPVCSNVLFNMKTEVVRNEGSTSCTAITDSITINKPENAINGVETINQLQAIRDTEYSHPELGNIVYHCGIDIFNNHMIRNDAFTHVGYYKSDNDRKMVFNTFRDFLVDDKGEIIIENIYKSGDNNKIKRHLYNADSLLSFKNAFLNKCKEENGWFGFYNSANINIFNGMVNNTPVMINRPLLNNKPCEFIDLYPDRSLYSFIPKYNKARSREEKNWNYTIVYPYASDEEKLNEVCGGENGAISFTHKRVKGKNKDLLECCSLFKHNLKVGSYVNFYYKLSGANGSFNFGLKARVESIGDRAGKNKDKVFNVDYNVAKTLFRINNIDRTALFYKRISNGAECSYYFRIFKSLETDKKLNSEINKIAFGRNIYGDELAQIVYTDDINLEGIVDNNGRPVSEIYLMLIKNNAGYKEWYKNNPYYGKEEIEMSHCFGKISSGLDFSGGDVNNEPFDYNIHYINNLTNQFNETERNRILTATTGNDVNILNTWKAWGNTILKNRATPPKAVEDEITIKNNEYYGDIVEFDPYYYRETVISSVYHRFNTAQRESFNMDFRDIIEDEIAADDFDAEIDVTTTGGVITSVTSPEFRTATYYLNSTTGTTHEYGINGTNDLFFGNVFPEGYYYKPFYKIKVVEDEENEDSALIQVINYEDGYVYCIENDNEVKELVINPPIMNPDFKIGGTIALYDKQTCGTIIGSISEVNTDSHFIKAKIMTSDVKRASRLADNELSKFYGGFGENRRYELYWVDEVVPRYGRVCKKIGRIVWRGLVLPSELNNTSSLYDTPFMNGRFYKNANINFFLRRQDPFGDYGLSEPISSSVLNQISTYVLNSEVKKYDTSPIEVLLNNDDLCY